jgi:hypothetical protein
MYDQPTLSGQEWALVIELLQHENDELPVEIHHCRVAAFREDLHRRLKMVQGILERLHATSTV